MKFHCNFIILLTVAVLILCNFVFSACSKLFFQNDDDPEEIKINDKYSLITISGNVGMVKKPTKDTDEKILLIGNFVGYYVIDDYLLLLEQFEDKTQKFWSFDLDTENIKNYLTYYELCSTLQINGFSFEPLWVSDFEIENYK